MCLPAYMSSRDCSTSEHTGEEEGGRKGSCVSKGVRKGSLDVSLRFRLGQEA
jgi:hypothetical protein